MADGTNYSTAGNWDLNSVPSGCSSQDTAQWDGVTTSNLLVAYRGGINCEFGSAGINLLLTSNQTNSVQLVSSMPVSPNLSLCGITNNSANAALVLGETNTAHLLTMVARPAGAVHHWVNNSANTVTINPSVRLVAGGGAMYLLDFAGTGNWVVNNTLMNSGGPAQSIQVDGPGAVMWNPAGYVDASGIGSPIMLNGGALVLKGNHPRLNSQGIANNAAFEFDAPSQAQTLSGVISGSGWMIVSNGTLTLSGQNTYTGDTALNGGELVVNGAESAGTSGPLGVANTISFNGGTLGFSSNNTFDYSPRFSTSAGQVYSFDTAGQSVAFLNGLTSRGGSLTKLGLGTLTLAGPSGYSGATAVSAGKLVFQGPKSGSGNIAVADGAALGITECGTPVTPNTLTLGNGSGCTLEFNSVTNTASAPLAVGAISSAGPVAIYLNSGSFTIGQSYPLISWSSGTAPAVILGTLAGAVGNLSTNGNTIQFNVISVSPPRLNFNPEGSRLQFSWTRGFKLQAQTNRLNAGLGGNWFDYPGGDASPVTVPIGVTNGAVFFRLVSTP